MRVLVTGATGFVGSHIAQRMVEVGYEVSVLMRSRVGWLKEVGKVEKIKGDLTQPHTLAALSQRVFDVVVHAGGLTSAPEVQDYYRVNTLGTYNLIRALKRAPQPLKLFVYISSLAAAGPGEMSEGDPERPITPYGESKLYAEFIVMDAGFPFLILRPPAIFGPRDSDVLRFFQLVKRGWLPSFSKRKRISILYVKNLVAALEFLLEKGERGTFFLSDGAYTWWDVGKMAAEILGVNLRAFPLHQGVLTPLAALSQFYRCLKGRAILLSKEKLRQMKEEAWICKPQRLSTLGFSPPITLRAALEETLEWYRDRRYL